jgi:hypothetical protein
LSIVLVGHMDEVLEYALLPAQYTSRAEETVSEQDSSGRGDV